MAAHYLGTSLFPEAKTYRLLADFLNDAAITLNALSPLLSTVHIPFCASWLFPESGSGLQMVALCLSGAMGALCGLAAGGSKSSLTLHFATPDSGKGDMGELSAKDASKETVLSLLGMLVSSNFIVSLSKLKNVPRAALVREYSCPSSGYTRVHLYCPLPASCGSPYCKLHSSTWYSPEDSQPAKGWYSLVTV